MAYDLPVGRPALMGILNVTPDSFSDGGKFLEFQVAVDHGLRMMDEGADLIDVGGESTRPGASEVSLDEELKRVLPVIEALSRRDVPTSIDTSKPEVARQAVAAGASVVNDVTGFGNPQMIEAVQRGNPSLCIMHMQGDPRSMQAEPRYTDVVTEVKAFLLNRVDACVSIGIASSRIWIDPGIGFGKTLRHNLELLRHLDAFVETGQPVLIGVSRKSFLGRILGLPSPTDRAEATLAAQSIAQWKGAKIIRAHDIQATRRAIDVVAAIDQPAYLD